MEDLVKENSLLQNLKPSEVVLELDRHIVGQADAKRAVAIAMRNRWRRKQLPDDLRKEVTPRNVLLVGPTGCGKTEVARRMAKLNDAPFIKVEATKFTEVGYHGRDVDQIIRDLMDISMALTRKVWTDKLRVAARAIVEDRILDLLTGPANTTKTGSKEKEGDAAAGTGSDARGRESFRDMLRQGILDDQEIEVDVPQGQPGAGNGEPMGGDGTNPNLVAMSDLWQKMSNGQQGGGKKAASQRKKLPISEAREVILEVELEKMLETVDLKKESITAVEESGIVFIDEIDKICTSRDSGSRSADASAEGVQRDLLPLIEGTVISTKYGNVNTDYILFIASGAFHSVKPSDLLPELQGRLPIRVELNGLTEDDLYKILTEPVANLIRQQVELISTEGVTLEFDDDAIREIARMAAMLNKSVENIGARRLHTVMERIMEHLSFEAAEVEKGTVLRVNKSLVTGRLNEVTTKLDLQKYIL
jgi:ATP-dependent HslUV protease ATP-binding subunit HslU